MKMTHFVALLLLVIGLVGCDHGTKRLARAELSEGRDLTLVSGVLDLRYSENSAAGFSVLRNVRDEIRYPLLMGLNILTMIAMSLFWYWRRRDHWAVHLALALFLAGGLGNLLDRLLLGHVIDFIYIHYWPIFNVADICLTVGALIFLIHAFKSRREQAEPA